MLPAAGITPFMGLLSVSEGIDQPRKARAFPDRRVNNFIGEAAVRQTAPGRVRIRDAAPGIMAAGNSDHDHEKKTSRTSRSTSFRAELEGLGEPAFRAKQIFAWLYRRGKATFGEFSDISRGLRDKLEEQYVIGRLEAVERLRSWTGSRSSSSASPTGITSKRCSSPRGRG